MRISLLNLPVDNNYGGHMQRYALMTVLQRLGHDVTHINYRFSYDEYSLMPRVVRTVKRLLGRMRGRYSGPIRPEHREKLRYESLCAVTDEFYNRYVKHTRKVYNCDGLKKASIKSDLLLIGSDQVWRKAYVGKDGLGIYFGDFIPQESDIRKVVYGASFGVVEDEFTDEDKRYLSSLYKTLYAVSVREESGIEHLKSYGWTKPEAQVVLDPTLLLNKEDYSCIIDKGKTEPLDGNMCCYILDKTESKTKKIDELVAKKGLRPFSLSIDGKVPVEQWLKSFRDADYVVTDSYHGLIFSIIMQKPFYLFYNSGRGNARFDSILPFLGIMDLDNLDWNLITESIYALREKSIDFIKRAISS